MAIVQLVTMEIMTNVILAVVNASVAASPGPRTCVTGYSDYAFVDVENYIQCFDDSKTCNNPTNND